MMNIARLLALASFSLVTACSGGIETAGGQSQAIKEALQAGNFGKRKKQAPPTPVLTRALLDQITVPSLEVTIENTGSTAYMIPLASRVNSGPGRVTVWKTGVSDENIILRNGVLVGTKGVSNDLGSADASATVRALNSRQSGGGARTHYYRLDDNSSQQIRLQCEITNNGRQNIEIVGKTYATTHMQEVCSDASGSFTNNYWLDSGSATVRKSRQWAGPGLGYLSFRLLKK